MYGFGYGQPQIIGNLARANNFNEVQSAPVAANGDPTMFFVDNEDAIYLVSLSNGQKVMQGFSIKPMPTKQEVTENRLNNLEAMMMNIQALLEGKIANESNTTVPEQTAASTNK